MTETDNRLLIYRSSAGSGKTYTIVSEYLRMALTRPDRFRQILAVTFTNKATDEMKSRIVQTLVEMEQERNLPLVQSLAAELKCTHEELFRRSAALLENILHHYSELAVTTIDSFFNNILQSFAYELNLPLHFETQIELSEVSEDITESLLMEAGKDKLLTEWLEDFLWERMDEGKGWNVDHEIKNMAYELFDDKHFEQFTSQKNISGEFIKKLAAVKNRFESDVKVAGEKFLTAIRKKNFSVSQFSYGKNGIAGFFFKLANREIDYPSGRVLSALQDTGKWVAKTSPERNAILTLVEKELHPLLVYVIKYFHDHFESYVTAVEVHKKIYMAGIMGWLSTKLKAYRDTHEIILVSDINRMLGSLIESSDADFIFEKTASRYSVYLMDEFQDTSRSQWRNMKPLIENALASGSSALVVGDAKQSIYRFRGGEMGLLQEIKEDLKQFERITVERNLLTNYRSAPEIIQFNNTLFSCLMEYISRHPDPLVNLKSFESAFLPGEINQQSPQGNSRKGYVEFFFQSEKSAKGEPGNYPELTYMLTCIRKLMDQGFRQRDITILVKDNRNGSRAAEFLLENGFSKIISSESLLLNQSARVRFLVHLLHHFHDPDDLVIRAAILNYVNANSKDPSPPHEWFASVHDLEKFYSRLPSAFSAQMALFRQLPVDELCEQLIAAFHLNQPPDGYIQHFQDAVAEFIAKNTSRLSDFIEWWEYHKHKKSVTVPENEDAIRIMTIHKSKGLQFRVVILPFTGWSTRPKSNEFFWVHSEKEPYNEYKVLPVNFSSRLDHSYFRSQYRDELASSFMDNINALYVAFTRAEERLYVYCTYNRGDEIKTASGLLNNIFNSYESFRNELHETASGKMYYSGVEMPVNRDGKTKVNAESSFDYPNLDELKTVHSTPWLNKLVLAVNPSRISVTDMDLQEMHSTHGLLVHRLLSQLFYEKDEPALMKMVETLPDLNLEGREAIRNLVNRAVGELRANKWLSNDYDVKNECEILVPDGTLLRPDRLMIRNKEVIVLDYKTGDPHPAHQKQMKQYADVLLKAGFSKTEGYLLYLKEMKLVKVESG